MPATMSRWLVGTTAALSLAAALLHFLVMPEHFAEWWGYGVFFLVAAVAQTGFAIVVLRRPADCRLLWAGVLGNLAIIALWAWTRTVGIPPVGPHAGEVEAVGAIDVASKITEALLIAGLVLLLRDEARPSRAGPGLA